MTPAPVTVTVERLDLTAWEADGAHLRVRASAGFYVRALAHELGVALGTGAHLAALRRTRAGAFTLADATPLDLVQPDHRAALVERLRPLEQVLPHLPAVRLTARGADRVSHGRDIGPAELEGPAPLVGPGPVQLLDPGGRLLALADPAGAEGFLHPSVVLR